MTEKCRRRLYSMFAAVSLLCLSQVSIRAQQPVSDNIAPPPLMTVSKEELTQLTAETSVKKRTRTALELMSARLDKAEALLAEERFDDMYEVLGGFHGLMDNTLTFLNESDNDSNKILNNYKRFEIGLRKFRPRLELIRRELPVRYEPYLRHLIHYLRDARTKAVESLFSDSVVPRRKP
ncbi:MAG: hypothetical protein AB7F88_10875 [Pyrinomonadaceae bacterium]